MIPATHWADGDDGTAWWVRSTLGGSVEAIGLDRPCTRCNGIGHLWMRGTCPDCDGTGRHEFWVEVGYEDHGYTGVLSHRVSVVPGMVLPIGWMDDEGECGFGDDADHVCVSPNRIGGVDGLDVVAYIGGTSDYITLPPAAKPGMYAIQLRKADR